MHSSKDINCSTRHQLYVLGAQIEFTAGAVAPEVKLPIFDIDY